MKTLLSLISLLAAAAPLFAAVPADFSSTRDILSPPLSSPQLAEVRLDAPLFALVRPGFPDLRLFDAAGTELPRLVEPLFTLRQHTTRHPVSARPAALQELPENRIEARFDLEKDAPSPNGLDIRTPLRDFIRTVRISGSPDGQTWIPLVDDAQIFDYSRYLDIRQTEIPLPSNSCRHFALEIGNASEERAQPLVHLVQARGQDQRRAYELLQTPFRIDGVSFWRETTTTRKDEPVLQDWPPSALAVSHNTKDHTTEITLDTAHAPVTRLVLETPDRNFRRAASVQTPTLRNGQTAWLTIARGPLTCIDIPGIATNQLAIDFPEQRAPQLRLVLDNQDNPPLAVTHVLPRGPVYRLLWLATPGTAYRLAAGHSKLPDPSYDLYAIRAALDQNLPAALCTLAPAAPVASVNPPFSLGEFLSRPLVFGSALVLAALALLALLAKALKTSTNSPQD